MQHPYFIYPTLTKEELANCLTAYQSTAALCIYMYSYADAVDDSQIYEQERYTANYMILTSLKCLIMNMFDGGNNKLDFLDDWHRDRVNTDGLDDAEVEIEILQEYSINICQLSEVERRKYADAFCELSALRENILAITRFLIFVEEDMVNRRYCEQPVPECPGVTGWKYALTSAAMHLWHIAKLVQPYHDRAWKMQEEYWKARDAAFEGNQDAE